MRLRLSAGPEREEGCPAENTAEGSGGHLRKPTTHRVVGSPPASVPSLPMQVTQLGVSRQVAELSGMDARARGAPVRPTAGNRAPLAHTDTWSAFLTGGGSSD